MSSLMAQRVAGEVIRQMGNGKKPNIYAIAVKKGYSPASARASKPQKTKAYKEIMRPIVEAMVLERDAALKRMGKVRAKATYRDLVHSMDILTKNIQLLSGGSTSNVAVKYRNMSDGELEQLLEKLEGEKERGKSTS